jgi:hypothetical protein
MMEVNTINQQVITIFIFEIFGTINSKFFLFITTLMERIIAV